MSGCFEQNIKHFDCTKNRMPCNFVGQDVKTGFYSHKVWKRCESNYGPNSQCKQNTDKWNIVNNCSSKWAKKCCNSKKEYYYGKNEDLNKCCDSCCNPIMCVPDYCNPEMCVPDYCKPYCKSKMCKPKCCKPECCKPCCKPKPCYRPLKSYVKKTCEGQRDVAIVYRDPEFEVDCDNIVEMTIPTNGSKERYLAKHFNPEFVHRNRFQCATVPYINACPNNVIDNMREEDFTVSDQRSLVARGVKDYESARLLYEEGKITNDRHNFRIEMNKCGLVSSYPKLGHCNTVGTTATGLRSFDQVKGYYLNCDC